MNTNPTEGESMTSPTIAPFQPGDYNTAANGRTIAALPGGAHFTQYFLSPAGITYGMVHVTPQIARAWLNRNTANRPLRENAAARFARDMAAGAWLENGDPVRFANDDTLLDGQHRLKAISDSGIGQLLLVVAGLPRQAQDTMDDGTKRTMADRLSFHDEPSPAVLASVLRRVILWEKGYKTQTGTYQPTVTETLEFLTQHRSVRLAASAAERYRKAKLLGGPTIGLCWWLFSRIDAAMCEEFFERLADGEMLTKRNPIYVLRERLRDLGTGPTRPSTNYTLALTVKAWNALREGREISLLRWSENENFPEPK